MLINGVIKKYFFIIFFLLVLPLYFVSASSDNIFAVVVRVETYESNISDKSNTPRNLNVSLNQSNQSLITWTDRSNLETGYLVERRVGESGEFVVITSLPSDSEHYADRYLEPGNAYYYRVRAFMGSDYSQYSDEGRIYVSADAIVVEKEVVTREEVSSIESSMTKVSTPIRNKFLEIVKEKETIARIIAVVGAASGAVVAATATSVPFLPMVPRPFQSNLFSFLSLPFYRKKWKKSWGVVFDDYTKRPVCNAIVTLVNVRGMVIDKTVTDKEGRYGFLVSKGGEYQLKIKKGKYKIKTQSHHDAVYGEVYDGGFVQVEKEGVIQLNIPLDPEGFDWDEFSKKVVRRYGSMSSIFKKYLLIFMGLVGLTFSIGVAYYNPNIINYFILAFHCFVIAWQIVSRFKKPYGMVKNHVNKKPMPFTVVSLHDKDGKREFFSVADVIGRYYLLAQNGVYDVRLTGRADNGQYITKEEPKTKIKKEILKKDYWM
ncbi:carboxypeptidase regulatory-like domain-containing protein [Patescibacteria group bacterium]